jgi:molybdopterin-biosynthesis enzyme MoeA-like protein
MQDQFGLIVVGDEILRGKRRDRHFDGFRVLLAERGFGIAWLQILPDDPQLLTRRLASSMAEGLPVFCCGGIGATPDDHTRQCAAQAAGVALTRHPGAVSEIEAQFGNDAYPVRILMADLPQGSELIPNPYNRVPGFSIRDHYFVPGFPDMAHPMARWVLDTYYSAGVPPERELALRVFGAPESTLLPLMQQLTAAYPELKLYSLPRLGPEGFVELGFRGREGLEPAFAALRQGVAALGLRYELNTAA